MASEEPVEDYSPERIAEFLLSNAVDADDYAEARREVEGMGLDPDTIPHARGVKTLKGIAKGMSPSMAVGIREDADRHG